MSKNQEKNNILVLLQTGLSPAVENFFKLKGFAFKTAETYSTKDSIQYILVDDHREDWRTIKNLYETEERRVGIISFTPVQNMKEFLAAGGKAVLKSDYFVDRIGQIFLKRLFADEVSLHMDETFGGNFLKYKSLKVANHNRSGYYSDIIAADAFEQDYNNVAIRGVIYNSIYYLSYLNQSGIAELPFDIEYAQSNKHFAIQIVATVKNFFLEYVLDSFGSANTNNPLHYILKENFKLAHSFDISFLEKANAVILTAIWTKRAEGEKVEPQFTFCNIKQAKQIILEAEEKIELAEIGEIPAEKEDQLSSKPLPGISLKMQEKEVTKKAIEEKTGEALTNIASSFVNKVLEDKKEEIKGQENKFDVEVALEAKPYEGLDEITTIGGTTQKIIETTSKVGGKVNEDSAVTTVTGSEEKDNSSQKISGREDSNNKEKTIVRGSKESNENTLIKGNQEDLTEEITRVKGKVDEDENVTIVKGSVSENDDIIRVKGKMDELAQNMRTLIKGTPDPKEQAVIVKQHVSELITDEIIRIKSSGDPNQDLKIEQLTTIVADKMGANKGEIKDLIVKGMEQVRETQTTIKGGTQTYTEAILVDKVKRKDEEIKQLNSRLEYLKSQLVASQQANQKAQHIASQFKNNSPQEIDNLKAEIGKKAEYQQTVKDEDTAALLQQMKSAKEAEALKKLAEREKELVEIAKNHELNLKKKEMEFHGKEVMFIRQLEAAEKGIKSKEFLINKTKESVKLIVDKKDNEIKSLNERLTVATGKLNSIAVSADPRLEQLKKEKDDLSFELDGLKKKLQIANKAVEAIVDPQEFKDEISKLKFETQRINNEKIALAGQNNMLKKETQILKDKIKGMESVIAEHRSAPLTSGAKTQADDIAKIKLDLQRLGNEKANLQATNEKLSSELNNLKNENADLKKRFREADMRNAVQQNITIQQPTNSTPGDKSLADTERMNAEYSKMIKERDAKIMYQTEKLQELEARIVSLTKDNENLSNQGEQATKGKVAQLEMAQKKLTADLQKAQTMVSESKKEITKIKAENTGYKNQVEKLKVELEKANKGKKAA